MPIIPEKQTCIYSDSDLAKTDRENLENLILQRRQQLVSQRKMRRTILKRELCALKHYLAVQRSRFVPCRTDR